MTHDGECNMQIYIYICPEVEMSTRGRSRYVTLYVNKAGNALIGSAKSASEISDYVTQHVDQ